MGRPRVVMTGARAGLAVTVLIPIVLVVLTVVEYDFLVTQGWSSVGTTKTQWPSLLALGPHGWLMSATFAIAAAGNGWLVYDLWTAASGLRSHLRSVLVAVVAVGLAGVAFPADLPTQTVQSWHALIHNSLYPVIPFATVAAVVLTATTPLRPNSIDRLLIGFSRAILIPMMLFVAATAAESVAQLARYFAFGSFLLWFGVLTTTVLTTRDVAPNEANEESDSE